MESYKIRENNDDLVIQDVKIIMEAFIGKWRLLEKENFDEFLKAQGINILLRKIANTLTPTEEFARHNDIEWIMKYVLDITALFH
jgi:hypothetical protein